MLERVRSEQGGGGDEGFDEEGVRGQIEATLTRRYVMDFLADEAESLEAVVEEKPKEAFDQKLMDELLDESIKREKEQQ